ncbi:hypothetical protein DN103_18975 [Salmonella enterica subsp. enterica serovar Kande]|nr:hypothetical protein [Salmonella enterica subsp. enterica serovar Kande]
MFQKSYSQKRECYFDEASIIIFLYKNKSFHLNTIVKSPVPEVFLPTAIKHFPSLESSLFQKLQGF